MNEHEHTSAPWVVRDQFPFQYIVAEAGNLVIVARMGGDSVEADARRVVACVNYLAGMPTEWLEKHSIDELLPKFESAVQP